MRHWMIGAAAVAALLGQAGAAHATATLLCSIKDRSVAFALQGAVGSVAASLSGLQGEIEMKPAGKAAGKTIELNADHLVQRWIDGPDLKLWLHADHDDKTPDLDLIIETRRKAKDSDSYVGRYRLTIEGENAPRLFAGKASCSID